MKDCLFCKIINGDIPSEKVYEDDEILAFRDIKPLAAVHVLIIPKRHIDGIDAIGAIGAGDAELVGSLVAKIPSIAESLNLGNGYRIVSNVKDDGGQTVRHLHFHLLGGEKLSTSFC